MSRVQGPAPTEGQALENSEWEAYDTSGVCGKREVADFYREKAHLHRGCNVSLKQEQ
jgi:hypothetical protein